MKRRVLLVFGLILIGAAAAVWFWLSIIPAFKRSKQSKEYAGYRMYASTGPFHVLVDHEFPTNKSVLFITDDDPIVFSFNQMKEARRSANLSIGSGFSAHVMIDAGDKPSQLWVLMSMPNNQEQLLQDLDLNGTWDAKTLPKENKRYIYINSTWLEVDRISGVGKSLIDASSNGHSYRFDRAKGIWEASAGN